jgi:hypothetical protein
LEHAINEKLLEHILNIGDLINVRAIGAGKDRKKL